MRRGCYYKVAENKRNRVDVMIEVQGVVECYDSDVCAVITGRRINFGESQNPKQNKKNRT